MVTVTVYADASRRVPFIVWWREEKMHQTWRAGAGTNTFVPPQEYVTAIAPTRMHDVEVTPKLPLLLSLLALDLYERGLVLK